MSALFPSKGVSVDLMGTMLIGQRHIFLKAAISLWHWQLGREEAERLRESR